MRKQRVLVLVSEFGLLPEDPKAASEKQFQEFKATADVSNALKTLGYQWEQHGMFEELTPLRNKINEWEPTIVFNLVDQFRDSTIYDQHIVSYLELLKIPFTGCNPRGLVLASDKALSKKILYYHRILTPKFQSFPLNHHIKLSKKLRFPLIIKANLEEASVGISQASIVSNEDTMRERIAFIHENFLTAALAEEYIDGREIYVGIIGNKRLQILPPWEIFLDNLPDDAARIATSNVKWNLDYQEKYGIELGAAKRLDENIQSKLINTSRRIYRALNLSGYARIDYRLTGNGQLYFLEANANPDISRDEELASAAKAAGINYTSLIQKIIRLGLRWAEEF